MEREKEKDGGGEEKAKKKANHFPHLLCWHDAPLLYLNYKKVRYEN